MLTQDDVTIDRRISQEPFEYEDITIYINKKIGKRVSTSLEHQSKFNVAEEMFKELWWMIYGDLKRDLMKFRHDVMNCRNMMELDTLLMRKDIEVFEKLHLQPTKRTLECILVTKDGLEAKLFIEKLVSKIIRHTRIDHPILNWDEASPYLKQGEVRTYNFVEYRGANPVFVEE